MYFHSASGFGDGISANAITPNIAQTKITKIPTANFFITNPFLFNGLNKKPYLSFNA
jgi:hypothetical protein